MTHKQIIEKPISLEATGSANGLTRLILHYRLIHTEGLKKDDSYVRYLYTEM